MSPTEVILLPIGILVFVFGVLGIVFSLVFGPIIRNQAQTRRLLQTGVAAQATILGMRDTRITINYSPVADVLLEVRPTDRPPFQAQTRVIIPRLRLPGVQPGAIVSVRYDPNDP